MKSLPKARIGDVCRLVNGRAFKPTDWNKHGLPIVRIQNLNNLNANFNYFNGEVKEKFLIDNGELLFSWSGTPGTSFGAFFWQRGRAVLNQHIFRVLVDSAKVDKNYFRYALNSRINHIIDQSHGGVGLKHITKGKLEATTVPFPTLTEELLRSTFLDMFGDPVTNPKGWHSVSINDIVSAVRDGPHVSPKYSDSGIPILSTRNVRPNKLLLEDVKYVTEETYSELVRKFQPKHGDVLLTKGGTTGYAKVVDWNWNFAVWVHLAVLRPKENVRPEFLEAALNSQNCYAQSQRYTHGIANRDLGLTRIRKIQLSLPPLELQDKYCLFREKSIQKLYLQQNSFEESDNLFNSLLQKAFRGEL